CVTLYNVVIVIENSRLSTALALYQLPDRRPEHRSPLVRQSLDCLLGIAPRDAGLGVLSGRVAFNLYPGLKHPTSQSLRRGWLFCVRYRNTRGAIASAAAAWANLFSRCAAIHASTSGLALVPRRKCPNTRGVAGNAKAKQNGPPGCSRPG